MTHYHDKVTTSVTKLMGLMEIVVLGGAVLRHFAFAIKLSVVSLEKNS